MKLEWRDGSGGLQVSVLNRVGNRVTICINDKNYQYEIPESEWSRVQKLFGFNVGRALAAIRKYRANAQLSAPTLEQFINEVVGEMPGKSLAFWNRTGNTADKPSPATSPTPSASPVERPRAAAPAKDPKTANPPRTGMGSSESMKEANGDEKKIADDLMRMDISEMPASSWRSHIISQFEDDMNRKPSESEISSITQEIARRIKVTKTESAESDAAAWWDDLDFDARIEVLHKYGFSRFMRSAKWKDLTAEIKQKLVNARSWQESQIPEYGAYYAAKMRSLEMDGLENLDPPLPGDAEIIRAFEGYYFGEIPSTNIAATPDETPPRKSSPEDDKVRDRRTKGVAIPKTNMESAIMYDYYWKMLQDDELGLGVPLPAPY